MRAARLHSDLLRPLRPNPDVGKASIDEHPANRPIDGGQSLSARCCRRRGREGARRSDLGAGARGSGDICIYADICLYSWATNSSTSTRRAALEPGQCRPQLSRPPIIP